MCFCVFFKQRTFHTDILNALWSNKSEKKNISNEQKICNFFFPLKLLLSAGISRPTTQSALESTETTGKLPLRKDVSLESILSCPNEIDDWRRRDLPSDQQSLQNALILRSCGDDRTRAWPLLVDPHNQAELWIAALHQGIHR